MALRVVEQAGLSDVGRQREANEDNLVLAAPVFAVADGMGGARAGEVASRMAAEAFGERREDGTPEQQLEAVAKRANRAIFDLAQRDDAHRGMGTTLTAAMVEDDCVSLAHVGDSRAYRLRDGGLRQLTHDHSLVAELERSGQLTPEAAENHPQRSIITRALGPEPDVEVDTHTHPARPGDVYLLCSDGLTGMISDDEVTQLLTSSGSLEEAAESLVRAANQRGGKDNITVVLFRVGDDGRAEDEQPTAVDEETIHRGLTADDVRTAVVEQERAGGVVTGATRRRHAPDRAAPVSAHPTSGVRRALTAVAALLILALVVAAGVIGARQAYFLGTDDGGFVTVYRGVPYELPLGVDLYSEQYRSGVPATAIPEARRERVLDHQLRGRSDAEDLVRQLEQGTLDPGRPSR
jgi:serine/threonine protein phosphatase PrpC